MNFYPSAACDACDKYDLWTHPPSHMGKAKNNEILQLTFPTNRGGCISWYDSCWCRSVKLCGIYCEVSETFLMAFRVEEEYKLNWQSQRTQCQEIESHQQIMSFICICNIEFWINLGKSWPLSNELRISKVNEWNPLIASEAWRWLPTDRQVSKHANPGSAFKERNEIGLLQGT